MAERIKFSWENNNGQQLTTTETGEKMLRKTTKDNISKQGYFSPDYSGLIINGLVTSELLPRPLSQNRTTTTKNNISQQPVYLL